MKVELLIKHLHQLLPLLLLLVVVVVIRNPAN